MVELIITVISWGALALPIVISLFGLVAILSAPMTTRVQQRYKERYTDDN